MKQKKLDPRPDDYIQENNSPSKQYQIITATFGGEQKFLPHQNSKGDKRLSLAEEKSDSLVLALPQLHNRTGQ